MSSCSWLALALLGIAVTSACSASRVTPETVGVTVAPGPCGRGLIVVESDYQSSNVSLLGFDGSVLSPSLLSSSAKSGGFGLGLSGDVVPPAAATEGSNVVLIDRTPSGILRFVDLASAQVAAELPVGAGFRANPHDYLQLNEHKAYVSRYDSNPSPGSQAWDQGGDILLVDPTVPSITGRIDLAPAMAGEAAQFTPNPGRLARVGARVFVLLASFADDYLSATSSRLVELDPDSDAIVSTLVLDGLHGCDALALGPDGSELAVACTGGDTLDPVPQIDAAGLALIDVSAQPRIRQRIPARTFGSNPLGFGIDYLAPNVLVFVTLGYLGDSAGTGSLDTLVRLDTSSAKFDEVLRSQSLPFSLGDVRCAAECGACFVADAERSGGSVLRFPIDDRQALGNAREIRAETQIGLPPRYLGAF